MASRDISEEDSSSELDELSDSEFDGWCDESNTMVQFEKPLFTALDTAPVIKIPHPLARKLMETLSLINPPITEILSFCKYYGFDHKSKSVDATQAAARETIASRFQGWVRVVCNKGISIWWRPSTGESQYIKPHSLVYKVDVRLARQLAPLKANHSSRKPSAISMRLLAMSLSPDSTISAPTQSPTNDQHLLRKQPTSPSNRRGRQGQASTSPLSRLPL